MPNHMSFLMQNIQMYLFIIVVNHSFDQIAIHYCSKTFIISNCLFNNLLPLIFQTDVSFV